MSFKCTLCSLMVDEIPEGANILDERGLHTVIRIADQIHCLRRIKRPPKLTHQDFVDRGKRAAITRYIKNGKSRQEN